MLTSVLSVDGSPFVLRDAPASRFKEKHGRLLERAPGYQDEHCQHYVEYKNQYLAEGRRGIENLRIEK